MLGRIFAMTLSLNTPFYLFLFALFLIQILPAANCHIPTLLLVVDMETWFTEKLTACSARNITGSVNGLLHSPSSTDPSLSQEIQNDLKLREKNIQKISIITINAVYETLVLTAQSKTTILGVSPLNEICICKPKYNLTFTV